MRSAVLTHGSTCDFSDCIVAVASNRDRDAFATLFRYFAPRVKAYLIRQGLTAPAADDLAQETLLAVWHKAASFDPCKSGAAAWIFTIARNLRIDRVRQESRPSIPRELLGTAGDQHPAGDRRLGRIEQEHIIARALTELPAELAEIIRLSFFEDRSHTEIERRLGIPLGTVKSRLRRAMHHLRLALGETE